MQERTSSISAGTLEALLAERDWVRRLARSLVADAHSADDVAQSAWLAALEHPPRHTRNLRSWLATLVHNTARTMSRGDARRARREREADRPPGDDRPEQALERAELVRSLVNVVLMLHEPYKSSLVFAYFESLGPREIAEREGVPIDTVNTRIKRGIKLVRAELERERHGGGERLLSALVLLAREPLSIGIPAPPMPAGVLSTAAVILMKLKVTLAVVLLVVLGLFVWSRRQPQVRPLEADLRVHAIEERMDPTTAGPAHLESSPNVGERVAQPVPASEQSPAMDASTIRIMALDYDEKPIAGAHLRATFKPLSSIEPKGPVVVSRETGADGVCTLSVPEWTDSESVRMVVEASGFLPTTSDHVFVDGLKIRLARGTTLTGKITEADTGSPAVGASIRVVLAGGHDTIPTAADTTVTDAAGEYSLAGVAVGPKLSVTVQHVRLEYPYSWSELTLKSVEASRYDIALAMGVRIEGTVVDVMTDAPLGSVDIRDNGVSFGRSDATGQFVAYVPEVTGMLQLRFELEDYCVYRLDARIASLVGTPTIIRMMPSVSITGSVMDDHGAPIVGAYISAAGDGYFIARNREPLSSDVPVWMRRLPDGLQMEENGHQAVLTDAQGHFELRGRLPSKLPIKTRARLDDLYGEAAPFDGSQPGTHATVSITVARNPVGATLRGHLFLNDNPVAGRVEWKGLGRHGSGPANLRGEFELGSVEYGDVTLTGVPEILLMFRDESTAGNGITKEQLGLVPISLRIVPGPAIDLDVKVTCAMANIGGHVRDASGVGLSGFSVNLASKLHIWINTQTRADGGYSFDVPAVPYEYRLMAYGAGNPFFMAPGPGSLQLRDAVHPGDQDIDFIIGTHGTLRVRAFDASDHRPIRPLDIWLRRTEESEYALHIDLGDARIEGFRVFELKAGTYTVVLRSDDSGYVAARLDDVVIEDGKTADREAEMRGGVDLVLQRAPDSIPLSNEARVYLLEESLLADTQFEVDSKGARQLAGHGEAALVDLDARRVVFDAEGRCTRHGLPPGLFRWKAWPPTLRIQPESIDVAAGSGPVQVTLSSD